MDTKDNIKPYTERQSAVAAFHAISLLNRDWFEGAFDPEARRYLAPLVLGVFLSYVEGRLATRSQVAEWMGVEHAKTARKYIDLAAKLGLVQVADSKVDGRQQRVFPTAKLLELMRSELGKLADDIRYAAEALLVDDLPERGQFVPKIESLTHQGFPVAATSGTNPFVRDLGIRPESIPHTWNLMSQPVGSRRGALEELRADYDETIRLTPENYEALLRRAEVLFMLGEYQAAIDDHTAAIKLRPSNWMLYYTRGLWYGLFLRDYSRAVEDFSTVIELEPASPAGYVKRGDMKLSAGEREGAIEDYRTALKIGTESASPFPHSFESSEKWEAYENLKRLGVDPGISIR